MCDAAVFVVVVAILSHTRLFCSDTVTHLLSLYITHYIFIMIHSIIHVVYDAFHQGPEVISVSLTPVLMVYSAMFTRWAWIVQPRNTFLAACHVTNIAAQGNQLRRALEYKFENGQEQEVRDMMQQAGVGGVLITAAIAAGPTIRAVLSKAETFGTTIASIAAADAGPFTVHFWAPMSKWLISGASFFDLQRPTEKISLAQYSALTLTGFFFSRYALLVSPINYALCSVNVAMFGSSGWHLARKINADYLHIGLDTKPPQPKE